MLKGFFTAIALFLGTLSSYSQVFLPEGNSPNYNYTTKVPDFIFIDDDNIPIYNKEGNVEVFKDQRLDFLVEKYNENKAYIGYRIQIYSGKEREAANKLREEFLKNNPDIPAHLIYQQPNFKLRIGDFSDRLKALRYFEDIKSEFPSAFVIKDEIVVEKKQ